MARSPTPLQASFILLSAYGPSRPKAVNSIDFFNLLILKEKNWKEINELNGRAGLISSIPFANFFNN